MTANLYGVNIGDYNHIIITANGEGRSFDKSSRQSGIPDSADRQLVVQVQVSFFKTSDYERFKNLNPKRVPGTCAWFYEHPSFVEWRSGSPCGLLWLCAGPGCGKSVLARALIDDNLVLRDPGTLCYFFFKDASEEQDNVATALCAILHQLFCAFPDLLRKHTAELFKRNGDLLKTDINQLWRLFIAAASDPTAGKIVCVLDGIDECRKDDREIFIKFLVDLYGDSSKKGINSKLRFLLTSRPYDDIKTEFFELTRSFPASQLAGESKIEQISREIEDVIKIKVQEIASKRGLPVMTQNMIERRLRATQNRTYLWLHLTLDELSKQIRTHPDNYLKVIEALPGSVEHAYEKLLAHCNHPAARKILGIIVAAARPLLIQEIDVALEVRSDSTTLGDLALEGPGPRGKWIQEECGLFVTIVESRVHLIHQTAREFLLRKTCNNSTTVSSTWKQSIDLQASHERLARICMTVLFFSELQAHNQLYSFQEEFLKYIRDRADMRTKAPERTDTRDRKRFEATSRKKTSTLLSSKKRDITWDCIWEVLYNEAQAWTRKHVFLDYAAQNWRLHVHQADNQDENWLCKSTRLLDIGGTSSCLWYYIYTTWNPWRHWKWPQPSALHLAVADGLFHEIRFLIQTADDVKMSDKSFMHGVAAAVAHPTKGVEFLTMFLDRLTMGAQIPDDVIASVISSPSAEDMLSILLAHSELRLQFTGEMLMCIRDHVFNDKHIRICELVESLIESLPERFVVEHKLARAIASDYRGRTVQLMLEHWGDSIDMDVEEEVLFEAISNVPHAKEVLPLLIVRCIPGTEITELMYEEAEDCKGNGALEILEGWRPEEFRNVRDKYRSGGIRWADEEASSGEDSGAADEPMTDDGYVTEEEDVADDENMDWTPAVSASSGILHQVAMSTVPVL